MAAGKGVGERLRELRNQRKLTQAGLAEQINVSREVIARWETQNGVIPKSQDVITLADFYSVSCDYILRGRTPENLTAIRDLGLSDEAIEGMQELMDVSPLGYGLLSDLFDSKSGEIYGILDCVEEAIKVGILQHREQMRLEEEDSLEYPEIRVTDEYSIAHEIIIQSLIRSAGEAFIKNAYEYVELEVRKHAAKENNP